MRAWRVYPLSPYRADKWRRVSWNLEAGLRGQAARDSVAGHVRSPESRYLWSLKLSPKCFRFCFRADISLKTTLVAFQPS